jgi:hypothetical protein
VFAIIFSSFDFNFNIAPDYLCKAFPTMSFCEKVLLFFSFNNNTMLTVGYGDIYPVGLGARTAVLLLQLVGFAVSSSALALFLRKVLRF